MFQFVNTVISTPSHRAQRPQEYFGVLRVFVFEQSKSGVPLQLQSQPNMVRLPYTLRKSLRSGQRHLVGGELDSPAQLLVGCALQLKHHTQPTADLSGSVYLIRKP